jgi:hypothetical protein
MKRRFVATMLVLGVILAGATGADAMEFRAGGNLEYYLLTKNVDPKFVQENDLTWGVSVQILPWDMVGFEADLKFYDKYFGGYTGTDKEVLAPQALVLVGRRIYGGAGIGMLYRDKWADKPFYILRAGFTLPMGEHLVLDLNANYQFMNFDPVEYSDKTLHTLDADIISAVAGLRLKF